MEDVKEKEAFKESTPRNPDETSFSAKYRVEKEALR